MPTVNTQKIKQLFNRPRAPHKSKPDQSETDVKSNNYLHAENFNRMRLSCIAKVSKLLSSVVIDGIYYDMTSIL